MPRATLAAFAALLAVACDELAETPEPESTPDDGVSSTDGATPGADAARADAASADAAPPSIDAARADAAPADAAPSCAPGEVSGCRDETARLICAADGRTFEPEHCPEDAACDDGVCLPLVCAPGLPGCLDRQTPARCNALGTAFEPDEPCPFGSACIGGECESECLLGRKDPTYIGCTYWSVDLDNYPDPFGDPAAVPHAVVLSNPSPGVAHVRISTQADVALPLPGVDVPPGEVRVYTFPRLDVSGTGITNHSFLIESDWPVVAYQFNPLNNENVASNDASLLLPAESLGVDYIIMTWPTAPIPEGFGLPPQHGYLTVVATREGTTRVTVTPAGDVGAGGGIEAIPAGEERQFDLERGEVLNLEASGEDLFGELDLTGSLVHATQPVAVFGGHEEAVVGDGCCAEHLEQQMTPVNTWGLRYLAAQAEPRDGPGDVWRVVAAENDTLVQTVPPQPDAASFRLGRGEWLQIESGESFEVMADKPVMVGQFLRSQEDTGDHIGDPAFILAVPVIQFRSNYTVLTPLDYQEDWLTVMRPAGALVLLDGEPIADDLFRGFGLGDFEMAWVPVEDGPHTVECDRPFGLVAYGYSAAVSYGYPGGMDLRTD